MDTKPENVQFLKSNYPYDGSVFREASTGHHPSNPYASQWRDAGYKPPQEVTMNPDSSLEELLTHPPTLPGTHATPDDIRDFLTYLLVHKRAFPQELARQIAERWTVGSGLELRQYSPSLFFELFGSELGWVLYREVQVWLWREKRFVVKYKTCK